MEDTLPRQPEKEFGAINMPLTPDKEKIDPKAGEEQKRDRQETTATSRGDDSHLKQGSENISEVLVDTSVTEDQTLTALKRGALSPQMHADQKRRRLEGDQDFQDLIQDAEQSSSVIIPDLSIDSIANCYCTMPEDWKKTLDLPTCDVYNKEQLTEATANLKPCPAHLNKLRVKLGMRETSDDEFMRRLKEIIVHTRKGASIKYLRATSTFSVWFSYSNEEEVLRKAYTLGAYKFMPLDTVLTGPDQLNLPSRELFSARDIRLFQESGLHILPSTCWGAKAGSLSNVAKTEFDMYLYHYQHRSIGEDDGQLSNMIYSITQQIARQDPALYYANVCLRGDNETRLVSLPLCAKYVRAANKVEYTNIPHGDSSVIVNEINFDADDNNGWYKFLDTSMVPRKDVKNWIDELARDSTIKSEEWTTVAAKQGQVLLFSSWLPTRVSGLAKTARRSVPIAFTAIKGGGTTLQNGELWEDIANCHRNRTQLPSPKGLHLPFRFSPEVEITGLGPLSDALVGRVSWDSPAVTKERDLIMRMDEKQFRTWYRNWKKQAGKIAAEALEEVEKRERKCYGTRSYFVQLENFPGGITNFPNITPDQEVFEPAGLSLEPADLPGLATGGENVPPTNLPGEPFVDRYH